MHFLTFSNHLNINFSQENQEKVHKSDTIELNFFEYN